MREFTLSASAYEEGMASLRRRQVYACIILLCLAVGLSYWVASPTIPFGYALAFYLPFLAGVAWLAVHRSKKKFRNWVAQYKLVIDEEGATWHQSLGAPVIIARAEATKLMVDARQHLRLMGGKNNRIIIVVPATLPDYAEAKSLLEAMAPLQPETGRLTRYQLFAALRIVILLLCLCVFMFNWGWATVVLAVVLSGLLVWGGVEAVRHKGKPQASGQLSWVSRIFLIVCMLVKAWWVWANLTMDGL